MRRLLLPFLVLLSLPAGVDAAASSTVIIKKGDTLYSVARANGLSVQQLRDLNGLKGNTIEIGQVLKVARGGQPAKAQVTSPKPQAPAKLQAIKPLPKLNAQAPAKPQVTPPNPPGIYTVRAGDTLAKIAASAGLTVDQLRRLNGLSGDTIQVGERIKIAGKIPPRVAAVVPSSQSSAKSGFKRASQAGTYTVKSGDTLGKIAERHGLSIGQLRKLNALSSDTIHVGQILRLSGAPVPTSGHNAVAAAPASQGTYMVRGGDTLGEISSKYGVSVMALQTANGIQGTVITVGQRLKIPARGAKGIPSLPAGMEARTIYTYVRVGAGETPRSFAGNYGTTPDVIRRLNALSTLNQIVPGAKLLVPSRMAVPVPPRPARNAASYRQVTVDGIPVQVVQVDLRHRNVLVAPVLPRRGLTFGSGATVSALTSRSGANALVNGSYFHPQTYAPAGDIVMQGRLLTWGRIPAALAITPDNRASITGSTTALFGRPLDSTWNGMETVVASGPRIVSGGSIMKSYSNVFQDPAVFGRAARSAIGLMSSRDLLLVSTHAKLSVGEMGRIMAALGSRDALLLDGGSSAGLSFNGSTVLNSVRKVSYGIGVFTNYTGRRYAR